MLSVCWGQQQHAARTIHNGSIRMRSGQPTITYGRALVDGNSGQFRRSWWQINHCRLAFSSSDLPINLQIIRWTINTMDRPWATSLLCDPLFDCYACCCCAMTNMRIFRTHVLSMFIHCTLALHYSLSSIWLWWQLASIRLFRFHRLCICILHTQKPKLLWKWRHSIIWAGNEYIFNRSSNDQNQSIHWIGGHNVGVVAIPIAAPTPPNTLSDADASDFSEPQNVMVMTITEYIECSLRTR